MRNIIDPQLVANGMSYSEYRKLSDDLVNEGKVTGTQQSDELTQYARLHGHRMQRLDSSVKLLPETISVLKKIELPQTWMVLTESWCGDAAQIVPIINAFTRQTDKIELKLFLRDENLVLMDLYLTHGKSRSIPKLIVANSFNMEELFNWGPRPAALQELMNVWVAEEQPFEEMKGQLHLWYAKDDGVSTQKELTKLLAAQL
ncbi:thioredoxin family protein [Segetibacter sp. 3557_3]|uniref:thioredoxin family protein n=1 Tax=Segetibacter sp. 3557_3 TaxID=2547429 RepID=UPI0010585CCC|nr:thioredoxin family protein [Segetibacter sp. 3557_3]TDH22961.1 thioredoxin family protein [Segetibacter sp. 3557_3]